MKKIIKLIICIVMCIICTSCGSSLTNKEPSLEMVISDLSDALIEKNPKAEIINTEVLKSYVDGTIYEITTLVKASSKYADWTYEVDSEYKKYDQGWMIENINWVSESYTVTRIPEANVLIEIIGTEHGNKYNISPENAAVLADNISETEIVELKWNEVKELTLVENHIEYLASLKYDAEKDGWISEDISSEGEYVPMNVDLTGKWQGISSIIEISDFSWEGFTLNFKGDTGYYHRISGHPITGTKEFGWYSNSDGRYVQFQNGGSRIAILVFPKSGVDVALLECINDVEKGKVKLDDGNVGLEDICNKITATVTIKANNTEIIKDVQVRVSMNDGTTLAIDAIIEALDSKNITYELIEFAGLKMFDKIDKYDTGTNNEYIWELYLNGDDEPVDGRLAAVEIEDGDRILLKRNSY